VDPRPDEPLDGLRFKAARQDETEAAPIRYVADLVGADTDSERAIRWRIALTVLCSDPLAIALTAAASAGIATLWIPECSRSASVRLSLVLLKRLVA
jgi:hypothetical protein